MARGAFLQPAPASAGGMLRPVLAVLGIATVLELLLLRTFTRAAIHIPDVAALETPYNVLADLGRYSYFVAATSLVATLALMAATIPAQRDARAWAAGLAIGLFAIVAILARAGAGPLAITAALGLAAVAIAAGAAVSRSPRTAAFALPITLAFALSSAYAVAQAAGGSNLTWLHASVEVPVVAGMMAAPFAFGVPLKGRTLAVAAAAAVIAFGLFAGNPSTSRILLLWNGGISGVFPGVVYAAAAASAAGALAGVARGGRWISVLSLLLVAAAGIGVENTYQTGLLVCALLLLATPAGNRDGVAPGPR